MKRPPKFPATRTVTNDSFALWYLMSSGWVPYRSGTRAELEAYHAGLVARGSRVPPVRMTATHGTVTYTLVADWPPTGETP